MANGLAATPDLDGADHAWSGGLLAAGWCGGYSLVSPEKPGERFW
jgi:hypothetical protein